MRSIIVKARTHESTMKQPTKDTPTRRRRRLNNLINIHNLNLPVSRLDLDLVALPNVLHGTESILANEVPRRTISDSEMGASLEHIIGECAAPIPGCHCDRAMERPGEQNGYFTVLCEHVQKEWIDVVDGLLQACHRTLSAFRQQSAMGVSLFLS